MPATTKQIVRDRQTDRQNTYKHTTKQNANCTHFKPFKPAASLYLLVNKVRRQEVIAIFRQSKISHKVDKGDQNLYSAHKVTQNEGYLAAKPCTDNNFPAMWISKRKKWPLSPVMMALSETMTWHQVCNKTLVNTHTLTHNRCV